MCVRAVEAGLDRRSGLAAALFFCSSKFIFQLDRFLGVEHCVSTSSCAGIMKEHTQAEGAALVLDLQLS